MLLAGTGSFAGRAALQRLGLAAAFESASKPHSATPSTPTPALGRSQVQVWHDLTLDLLAVADWLYESSREDHL